MITIGRVLWSRVRTRSPYLERLGRAVKCCKPVQYEADAPDEHVRNPGVRPPLARRCRQAADRYLIAGVNGSGKTTSIAKLSQYLKDKGNTILLAACKSIGCTGLILTKLDGTAKGGIVVAVRQTMNLPVKFIGIGELDDLQPFDADTFVESLFVA